ncbi:hypothetical protein [Aeropyrum pernix]|nr:hypothetical protein [Aeropyrum pernix]
MAFKGENHVEIIQSIEKLLRRRFDLAFGGTGVYTREEVVEY